MRIFNPKNFILSATTILIVLVFSTALLSQEKKQCSAVSEGLEFCADSGAFSFKLGEKVIIPMSLHNTTQKAKIVKSAPDGVMVWVNPPYRFIVTDEKGSKFPTIEDDLRAKQTRGTITTEETGELFLRCCINKGSRWGNVLELAPGQEFKFEEDLSADYNFHAKGKYYLEIIRNVVAQNQKDIVAIHLESITIEIK